MSSNGKKIAPVFDFSGVSRQWSMEFTKTAQTAAKAQLTLQRPIPKGATDEQIQAYYDRQDAALDSIGGIAEEQLRLVSKVLKSVPREWLIEGAPDELDWNNSDSYNWIQDQYYTEILQMIQSGEARKTAKN